MKIENNKIVEATEEELYTYWLRAMSDLMPFDEYRWRMENIGVKIIEDK